jgi:predicted nucleic acid-binding protein
MALKTETLGNVTVVTLTGKLNMEASQRGGRKASPLPDFYIGAHAAVADLTLLTRDPTRYRTYFPKLRLIAP